MVSAITSTSAHNVYTSAIQNQNSVSNYTQLQNEKANVKTTETNQDSGIISSSILNSQNEIFHIQLSTQSGIALISTAESAVSDMRNILSDITSEINSLSSSSSASDYSSVQNRINELLEELYETKNSATFDGALIFGEYNVKPTTLIQTEAELENEYLKQDSKRYMESATYQIGYSTSDNSYLEFDTAFSLGGYSLTIANENDIASALGVTDALDSDLEQYYNDLETNKELLYQNNSSAAEYMKNLVSYTGEAQISDTLNTIKNVASVNHLLITELIAPQIGATSSKLSEVASKIWAL